MHNICHIKTYCILKTPYNTRQKKKKCQCHYTNISLFHPSFIFPKSCSPRFLYDFFMKSENPVKTSCLLPSFPALLKVCGSYPYNDPTIPCRFLLSSCFCILPAVLYVSDIVVRSLLFCLMPDYNLLRYSHNSDFSMPYTDFSFRSF